MYQQNCRFCGFDITSFTECRVDSKKINRIYIIHIIFRLFEIIVFFNSLKSIYTFVHF